MEPTRRTVLLAGAVSLAGACNSGGHEKPTPVDPDVALTAAAVAREQELLARYDEALAAAPALAARLAPLRAEHAAHLAALQPATTTATPTAAPTATPARAVPQPPAQVLRQLAALERTTAGAHAAAAVTASRELAPVLASLAASESSHAVVL